MKLKNKIQSIIEALKESDINHIEISSFWGAQKIKMIKNVSNNEFETLNDMDKSTINTHEIKKDEFEQNNVEKELNPTVEVVESNDNSHSKIFKSPLVGTYYQSSKPGEAPFIEKNQKITKGQVVCIIEAMKIFNEIESDHEGVIVEILIEDGQPVEYGQGLFKIKEQ